jgi:hypothetical protein
MFHVFKTMCILMNGLQVLRLNHLKTKMVMKSEFIVLLHGYMLLRTDSKMPHVCRFLGMVNGVSKKLQF